MDFEVDGIKFTGNTNIEIDGSRNIVEVELVLPKSIEINNGEDDEFELEDNDIQFAEVFTHEGGINIVEVEAGKPYDEMIFSGAETDQSDKGVIMHENETIESGYEMNGTEIEECKPDNDAAVPGFETNGPEYGMNGLEIKTCESDQEIEAGGNENGEVFTETEADRHDKEGVIPTIRENNPENEAVIQEDEGSRSDEDNNIKESETEKPDNNERDREHQDTQKDILPSFNPADPNSIPKFMDELTVPPAAVSLGTVDGNKYYEIIMRPTYHYFHRMFPPSIIWGYNGICPGPTFEVEKDKTVLVKWVNNLPDKHFLPVDHTLHGAIDGPEVRSVVHLHGANVEPESDGHPEAWYTRDYEHTGPAFKKEVYTYTNHQQAAALWYHDHSLGITRLNVYAGLAGFYIIRDRFEKSLQLPEGKYEVPLMIQDKSFNEDGSLFYPELPPFPVKVKPSVVPAFAGNTITVNGKIWPYMRVEPRKYRFRILNASNTRAYNLSFSEDMNFHQIGTDGGLLDKPIKLSSILLEPAERVDIIVDFSGMQGKQIILKNTADISPNTGIVMQFRVVLPMYYSDTSKIPEELYPARNIRDDMARRVRNLTLSAGTDDYGRPMLSLNNAMWEDPATEKPELDSIEIWNLINLTNFPHPIHVHLVEFKILDRRPFDAASYVQGKEIPYTGPAVPPEEFERGWKDTVRAESGMVTRIIMHFKDHVGNFVWHCHILEHEDHDMMRPLRVMENCRCNE